MKQIIILLLLFPFTSFAQTYKHIGIEDGLSNRKIFSIQKDTKDYMWFLTSEGMDRYNGKEIKHYKLRDRKQGFTLQIHSGWLYTCKKNELWIIGTKGSIFHYDDLHDRFNMVYNLSDVSDAISFGYMDNEDRIWLCGEDYIFLYNIGTSDIHKIPNSLEGNITAMEQVDNGHFFIATDQGIQYVEMRGTEMRKIPTDIFYEIYSQVNEMYYHKDSQRLFIGTFEEGILVYDLPTRSIIRPKVDLSDVSITCVSPLNDRELLFATEGMGVYKISLMDCVVEPYLVANNESGNRMNGNNINDIYIDEKGRIWLADYPSGITVVDNRYKNYLRMKHTSDDNRSIVNDQVNAVLEDSEGDLWFATGNGISLYQKQTSTWHSFLSMSDRRRKNKNYTFITLCEVSPGVVWAGGYTSGIYKITKRTLSAEYFSPFLFSTTNIHSDKYIRSIIKDSRGCIWTGDFYGLKCFNMKNDSVRLYPEMGSVTTIHERDKNRMWVGTTTGLYLLDRHTGEYQEIPIQCYINSLFQSKDSLLYVGTGGSGMLVYDSRTQKLDHYNTDNSALISNNIYTILPEMDEYLTMSTDNGVTRFYISEKKFQNWTREQGLEPACFNPASGTLLQNGGFLLGSTEGAVEFPAGTDFPDYAYSGMILGDFRISYRAVYPGDEDSPLICDIDNAKELKLEYVQNTFSLNVSSINYDSPTNTLYSWKLEGFYHDWTTPGTYSHIRFTNLPPGNYTLRIRALSKEEPDIVFEERFLKITVLRPIWLGNWAICGYLVAVALMFIVLFRILYLKKEQKISKEKTRFFINTAHDIRTPLTLIKAPLEELYEEEAFSDRGRNRMKTALANVEDLLRLTGNLINFERTEAYSSELLIAEYELDSYLRENYDEFRPYATSRHIDFSYTNNTGNLKVWFDREKMDSILKNVLSNALKYTPRHGRVSILADVKGDCWKLEVKDTGIGISAKEQSKLFKVHFRAINAINSKVTGSGIGLMLVYKLVCLHNGKISIDSTENTGTTVRISFPKEKERFHKFRLADPDMENERKILSPAVQHTDRSKEENKGEQNSLQRVLIVEDNDQLRMYLEDSLSGIYNVQTCCNGKEALAIVKEFWPELILSDIMMPQMGGDELCTVIKADMETSHIPVLLLTALSDEENMLRGLDIGADDYITKPFNIRFLKASMANLLANRALLRRKYATLDEDTGMPDGIPVNCSNALDWKFIASVRKHVEKDMDNPDFTIDSLCASLNMSRSSFYNKLKALTGQSPIDYIKIIRLKRAAELLKEGKYSISEIAEMTGFCDSKYFREVFKKHFNVSPSRYGKETPAVADTKE